MFYRMVLCHPYRKEKRPKIRIGKDPRLTMAYVHLFRNNLQEGINQIDYALSLDQDTLFLLDSMGYLLTMLGDWDRGTAMIKKTIRLNPYYCHCVHYALWTDCIRRGEYGEAYQETIKLNRPLVFWDHLARASSLGLIGNIEDGRKSADELRKLKPEFHQTGRNLIGRYIKFDDIVEAVLDGLGKVGVVID